MRTIGLAFFVRILLEFPILSPGGVLYYSVYFGDRQEVPGVRVDLLAL